LRGFLIFRSFSDFRVLGFYIFGFWLYFGIFLNFFVFLIFLLFFLLLSFSFIFPSSSPPLFLPFPLFIFSSFIHSLNQEGSWERESFAPLFFCEYNTHKMCEKVSSFCRRRYDQWCKLDSTLGFSENPRAIKSA